MRFLLAALLLLPAACGAPAGGTGLPTPAGASPGGGTGASGGTSASGGYSASNGTASVQPGTLTAGAWDDNRNYDFFTGYLANHADLPGAPPLTSAERDAAAAAFSGQRAPHTTLDVAFVIDTTGSMGDELAYLTTEFEVIAASIDASFPSADQRWALVVYRDQGDVYLTRTFAFTRDVSGFRTRLAAQSANGGGDYPESPAAGLDAAVKLGWRTDAQTARLVFWVGDAPQHDGQGAAMATAIRGLRHAGVHVYPVAASGTDELLELTMRSAAQVTGGRYLFLTDDSGVGGTHKEPTIPCYFVTKLNMAMNRMISIELSGEYREPNPDEILRTGGDPADGHCQLTDGTQVDVF